MKKKQSDGYPMQDVIMRWKGDRKSITGVDSADIPQFSIVKYDISSAVESLATGQLFCTWLVVSVPGQWLVYLQVMHRVQLVFVPRSTNCTMKTVRRNFNLFILVSTCILYFGYNTIYMYIYINMFVFYMSLFMCMYK